MTGEQLFLRFAVPCAELRLQRGQILQEQYDELLKLVVEEGHPDRGFLHQCFPNAVDDLYEFSRVHNLNPWEYVSMLRYWQQHQGRSPVEVATIIAVKDGAYRVYARGKDHVALNPYGIRVRVGHHVYLHNHWIVMIQETLS